MRKVVAAALTIAVVLAAAGVAYAVNVYELTKASTVPSGVGTPTKPIPKGVSFDYTVKDENGPRGAPVEKYRIAFQGLTTKYAGNFKSCAFGSTDDDSPLSVIMQRCKAAVVGSGRIETLVTGDATASDPNSVLFYCNLRMTLIAIPGGISIRLDADNLTLPTSQDGPIGCIVNTHRAIKTKFVTRKIAGVPSSSLEFSVPEDLRHNSGFSLTVARTTSSIAKKTAKAKVGGSRRTIGYYSAIGCGKKNKRIVQVTFVDENGVSSTERKSGRC
jgi:hypothetical protein